MKGRISMIAWLPLAITLVGNPFKAGQALYLTSYRTGRAAGQRRRRAGRDRRPSRELSAVSVRSQHEVLTRHEPSPGCVVSKLAAWLTSPRSTTG
jgi:hypothetical protein